MTSPVDPSRPSRRPGRPAAGASRRSAEPEVANLPVPVGRARTVPRTPVGEGDATFAAHLMGQDGQKRGLRAGPGLIDAARSLYNRTQWSGEKDRRARTGRGAKTDV